MVASVARVRLLVVVMSISKADVRSWPRPRRPHAGQPWTVCGSAPATPEGPPSPVRDQCRQGGPALRQAVASSSRPRCAVANATVSGRRTDGVRARPSARGAGPRGRVRDAGYAV